MNERVNAKAIGRLLAGLGGGRASHGGQAVAREERDFIDSQWPGQGPDAPVSAESSLGRIAGTYLAARTAVGLVLLVALVGMNLSALQVSRWSAALMGAYAALAALSLMWERSLGSRAMVDPSRHHALAIGIDLLAFAALQLSEDGRSMNFAPLLAMPVLMAGILLPRRLAMGTAAGASIILLLLASRASIGGRPEPSALASTGVAGAGLFLVAWLSGELALRLAREQQRAQGSMKLARRQAQLNRLMIDGMAEGVLVVDRQLRVWAANPAARKLLAVDAKEWPLSPLPMREQPAWGALADAVERGFDEMRWPQTGRDLSLQRQPSVQLRVRMRFTGSAGAGAPQAAQPSTREATDFCLLLLEESGAAQARVQQEKLAAMGRVSAGIAHEIRNPLAAIAQANALLSEEELPAAQRQLAGIVADNVTRLQRIVDDVLQAIPATAGDPIPVDAVDAVRRAVQSWIGVAGVNARRVELELPQGGLRVDFDPEHLRRVVVNLMDNAHRHAISALGSVRVRLAPLGVAEATLTVSNDGPLIEASVQARLFEPFFSTYSRGSGLGLYICRELCQRYGARIEYRPIETEIATVRRLMPAFVVSLRRAS